MGHVRYALCSACRAARAGLRARGAGARGAAAGPPRRRARIRTGTPQARPRCSWLPTRAYGGHSRLPHAVREVGHAGPALSLHPPSLRTPSLRTPSARAPLRRTTPGRTPAPHPLLFPDPAQHGRGAGRPRRPSPPLPDRHLPGTTRATPRARTRATPRSRARGRAPGRAPGTRGKAARPRRAVTAADRGPGPSTGPPPAWLHRQPLRLPAAAPLAAPARLAPCRGAQLLPADLRSP